MIANAQTKEEQRRSVLVRLREEESTKRDVRDNKPTFEAEAFDDDDCHNMPCTD
ncbi:MAG: hypothetical protein U0271_19030 [Polyangiaceae bacterium]